MTKYTLHARLPLKSKIDGAYFPSLRGFAVVLFTLHKLTLLFAKAVIDVIKKNFSRFLQIIVTGRHSIGTKIEYLLLLLLLLLKKLYSVVSDKRLWVHVRHQWWGRCLRYFTLRYGELFPHNYLFFISTRSCLRNFDMRDSYHSVIMRNNPILPVVIFFVLFLRNEPISGP